MRVGELPLPPSDDGTGQPRLSSSEELVLVMWMNKGELVGRAAQLSLRPKSSALTRPTPKSMVSMNTWNV